MTKEGLEKETEVFATYYESLFPNEFETFYKAFLKVAEPREKRIEELEMTVGTLRTFSNEQATCIERLQAQIEKMKCCGNCQTVRDAEGNCYLKKDGKCKNLSEWEIKEK